MYQVLHLESSHHNETAFRVIFSSDLPDTVTCYNKKFSIISYVHLEKYMVSFPSNHTHQKQIYTELTQHSYKLTVRMSGLHVTTCSAGDKLLFCLN